MESSDYKDVWNDDKSKPISERSLSFFNALGLEKLMKENPDYDFHPLLNKLHEFAKPVPRKPLKQYTTFNHV